MLEPTVELALYLYRGEESVDGDPVLLPVAPDAGHGLQVVGRVPVDVVEDQTRRPDQVQTHSACLRAQQEHD